LKTQLVHTEPLAPRKPPEGAACNGCGLCCLAEPCPLSLLLFRNRKGPCAALRWDQDARIYRCGAISDSRGVAAAVLPRPLQFAAPALSCVLVRLAPRWVAAGEGCDSSLVAALAPKIQGNMQQGIHDA